MSSDPWVLFHVSGMSCGGCERSVVKALGRLGATGAQADAASGRAWAQLAASRAEEARAAIGKAGFTAGTWEVVDSHPIRA